MTITPHQLDKNEIERELDEFWRKSREDWVFFAENALGSKLDEDQKAILRAVQKYPRVSVASGTARGKDYITAVACICFFFLTPKFENGVCVENTKVAMTAPTGRQVENIMQPEISRLFKKANRFFGGIGGARLVANDIRTTHDEWFLTGFKADENQQEAWTGFHASNTMFAVTEASGISEKIFEAIEGNLQGNSRILIVFNPNTTTGYAARSQRQERWKKFRLNSLSAPNVVAKEIIIPGQVDYEWIKDKLDTWCTIIPRSDMLDKEDDFEFEGVCYRPNDAFRKKVLGCFPKVADDVLIPPQWFELAVDRWKSNKEPLSQGGWRRLGVDVAGQGRDCSVLVDRQDNYIHPIKKHHSGGQADHMKIAGEIVAWLRNTPEGIASVDTIGEGAGTYSRVVELGYEGRCISAKGSHGAKVNDRPLTDETGQHRFTNMRAYMHWAFRDWLDPDSGNDAMLPPSDDLFEEATEVKFFYTSKGEIQIEPKEKIIERLKRSPDELDAVVNTFYPDVKPKPIDKKRLSRLAY